MHPTQKCNVMTLYAVTQRQGLIMLASKRKLSLIKGAYNWFNQQFQDQNYDSDEKVVGTKPFKRTFCMIDSDKGQLGIN